MKRVVGAILGSIVGTGIFYASLQFGIHLLAVVGFSVGIVSGMLGHGRSIEWGAALGLYAIVLAIALEAVFVPFAVNQSIGHFLSHLSDLPVRSMLSMGIGGIGAFYFGMGRNGKVHD